MNIKTKEFNTSEDELCYITRTIYYKSKKALIIVFGIVAVISVIFAVFVTPQASFLAAYFVILLGCILFIPFVINTAKSIPKIYFNNRACEITDNYFITSFEDGSLSKMHLHNFTKVTRESEYYFLYMAKIMFQYLPVRAFNSENDINEFETLMKNKKLME
ncbi:YcxB family protein [Synechocystis sp. PCC 7509]|uniref:YcxB family protein n=1 Tax=Synechocystis sp. PCC 7509 TaxID=927677 RepID=UPI0002AC2F97|nr:YcxB family protein [Synechocystis sp. PCC 7509]